jgi:hypothetical protein
VPVGAGDVHFRRVEYFPVRGELHHKPSAALKEIDEGVGAVGGAVLDDEDACREIGG